MLPRFLLFDGYDHDLALMRAEYPALEKVAVEKQFLRPKPPAPQQDEYQR